MAMLVSEAGLERAIRARRQARGLDGHDEVWDGVYFVPPLADNDHQDIVGGLTTVFQVVVGFRKLGRVQPGANVSDKAEDWKRNYRVPDVLVFLAGNPAVDKASHWLGGPDLAVEVVSRGDRSREKLDFYARTNVRELLCVDRHPWSLELYRNLDGAMVSAGRSTVESPGSLASTVVPLSFRLLAGGDRPAIEVAPLDGSPPWLI